MLQLFLNAVERFRMPMRLRTDHGTENVLIARYMLKKHGVETRPVITGKSMHNQRIERLWVDVFIYVVQQFRNIFYFLEEEHHMNQDNDLHMFALHRFFSPKN